MQRTLETDRVLIAINFSPKDAGRVAVGPCALARDLETGDEKAALDESDGETWLTLPPWGIAVLTGIRE